MFFKDVLEIGLAGKAEVAADLSQLFFAVSQVNEQETFRRGSAKKNYDAADSIIRERAAREIYLKPFEMLVRDAGISFVKI